MSLINNSNSFSPTKIANWTEIAMTEETISSDRNEINWKKNDSNQDLYVNFVCQSCSRKKDDLVILKTDSDLAIVCEECSKQLENERGFNFAERIPISSLDFDKVCEFLELKDVVKFISGHDLFINFFIRIKNYRAKPQFCNL